MTRTVSKPGHIDGAYNGVPVLVLGASGFIGRWVARMLTLAGARLTCAVRDPGAAQQIFRAYGVTANSLEVDLADPIQVDELVARVRPAAIFNLAGYGVDRSEKEEVLSWRLNSGLIMQLAELAERNPPAATWEGMRIIHAGSALEYGRIGGDLAEDATPNPDTLYGRTKLAGTQLLAQRPMVRSVTARLFTVYGPGEHQGRLLPSFLEGLSTGAPIQFSAGLQRRDFTYVEDVAEGLLRLGVLPSVRSGVVNLATGHLASVREFVELAASELHIPSSRLAFGALPTRDDEMPHDPVSVERLRQTLHWVPSTSIREGVSRTSAFLADAQRGAQ